MKLTIAFDGGCVPNPGKKYGSYQVTSSDNDIIISQNRFELGMGTNNEAEFDSLIACLSDLIAWLSSHTYSPSNVSLLILTDSKIVQRRVNGEKRGGKSSGALNMRLLAGKVLVMLHRFKSWSIEWNGRENNVQKFGH